MKAPALKNRNGDFHQHQHPNPQVEAMTLQRQTLQTLNLDPWPLDLPHPHIVTNAPIRRSIHLASKDATAMTVTPDLQNSRKRDITSGVSLFVVNAVALAILTFRTSAPMAMIIRFVTTARAN